MAEELRVVEPQMKIPVDPEPTSLRLALLVVLAIGTVIGYVLTLRVIADTAACSPLALIFGVAIGAGVMQIAELFLKPMWKSNTWVELSPTQLNILRQDRQVQVIEPDRHPRLHMWRFQVSRTGRVPKGWYVIGLAAETSDIFLPVYALLSPEQYENLSYSKHFTELISKSELKQAGGDSMRLSGVQRRLLKAEAARDLHGVEMVHEDFVLYLDWIKMYFPEWLPTD